MSRLPMTRSIVAMVAVLIAGSVYGVGARDHNDHRALTVSLGRDVTSCSVTQAKHESSRGGITIKRIRFENAQSVDDSPSVTLRFEMHNDTAAAVAGTIVAVSLFASAEGTLETSPLLKRPFRVLVNEPLAAGYSLDYRVRLKNLALETACASEVVIVGEAVSPTKSSSVQHRLEKGAATTGTDGLR